MRRGALDAARRRSRVASSSTRPRAASSPRCSPRRAPRTSRSSRRRRARRAGSRSSGRSRSARCAARSRRGARRLDAAACSCSPTVALELGSTLNFSVVLDDGGAPIAGRAQGRARRSATQKRSALRAHAGLRARHRRDGREPIACAGSAFLARIERRAEKRVLIGAIACAARRAAGRARGLGLRGHRRHGSGRARAARERRRAPGRRRADRRGLAAERRFGVAGRESVLGAQRAVRHDARGRAPCASGDRPRARSGRVSTDCRSPQL